MQLRSLLLMRLYLILHTERSYLIESILCRFPRREDYEEVQVVQLDETFEEKLTRLLETIETSQFNIKEVVDKDILGLEEKIFRILDLKQVRVFNCESVVGFSGYVQSCDLGLIRIGLWLNRLVLN